MNNFSFLYKLLIHKYGLQSKVARALGINIPHLSKLKNGKYKAGPDIISKAQNLLGIVDVRTNTSGIPDDLWEKVKMK